MTPGSVTSKATRKNKGTWQFFFPIKVLIAVLLLWFLISYVNLIPAYAFPSPVSVLKSFKEELLL